MPSKISIEPDNGQEAVAIIATTPAGLNNAVASMNELSRAWIDTTGFTAAAGKLSLLPDRSGSLAGVILGLGDGNDPFNAGVLSELPAGSYRLGSGFDRIDLAALAVALGAYRFGSQPSNESRLRFFVHAGVANDELRRAVDAVTLARDLINTPANRMGPSDLAIAVREIGSTHDAAVSEIVGDSLLSQRFPMVYAVGAAAAAGREPRIIDLRWGDPLAPKVTLVGKGVCFDTGGLDIKNSVGMRLMKKDMGGAANAVALSAMIMDASLPVRLRLLIPAVDNAISGRSFRPGDILVSRKGLAVEIGNTDAEGRLILADALACASEEAPDILIDFATLTGAARVALGPELPALFSNDDALAADVEVCAKETADPLWRMPLWMPYLSMIESRIADIDNAGTGGFAGAITAALFLSRFVDEKLSWLHADISAWNPSSRPARPEGGEAQTIRAVYAYLKARYRQG